MKTGLRMQSKNCCGNLHERNICMWWPEAQNGVYHMDFLAEHWLSVGVGVFWLSMVLYGHYRGLVRIAVTLLALILSLVVTRVAMPCVTAALNHNTAIHQMVGESLLKMAGAKAGMEETDAPDGTEVQPSYQRNIIENLKLPEQMKEVLLENNNSEIYRMLGVNRFFDYLGSYLATMVIRTFGSGILFAVVFLFFRMGAHWLDQVARLPIISELNQLAGALLGGVAGLLIIWLAGLIIKACSGMVWAQPVLIQIEKSWWLSLLYQNNLFNWLFLCILKGFS